jgi:YYY domain-containing protein
MKTRCEGFMDKNIEHDRKWGWLYDLLLVIVLLAGTYFRLLGVGWDENQHPHPDERFLTMVETGITPVLGCKDANLAIQDCPLSQRDWLSVGQYFDTATSPLNPYNRNFGSYVYGTLPLFLTRYVAEIGQGSAAGLQNFGAMLNDLSTKWHLKFLLGTPFTESAAEMRDWTGYDGIPLVGRRLSAFADLGAVFLLYLIVRRVYDRRVALLAAAFSALAVMQIQQSHFFTTDNFVTFFMILTLYFAVKIATENRPLTGFQKHSSWTGNLFAVLKDADFLNSIWFGVALGMAVASKLNAVPIAVLLPGAFVIRYFRTRHHPSLDLANPSANDPFWRVALLLVIGAIFSALALRVFQPYMFKGLVGINPQWLADIKGQRLQAAGDVDVPFALQWARRSHLFSFENLTVWGLGLPLGILAWAGFLWMLWRSLKGEWKQHLLLWGWTAFYFLWQSIQFNPTMRYQLPIYPLLCMMAAWVVIWLWDYGRNMTDDGRRKTKVWSTVFHISSVLFGVIVLVLTAAWAYAFTRIYTRTETRLAASLWIFQNVPGPVNLQIQQVDGSTYQQPLPYSSGFVITSETPYSSAFMAQQDGVIQEIILAHVADSSNFAQQTLNLSLNSGAGETLATGSVTANFSSISDVRGATYTVHLSQAVPLVRGQVYGLQITTTGGSIAISGTAVANETDWDLGIPFRTAGYDPFGGIYRGDLNFQVYWDDNADKLARFTSTLDQTDYIFIPSNHQFAQIVRLPERYPLTTEYYRELLGCPADKDIIWCYYVAEPGMFKGNLGFDLVATFESYPTLGPITINDQFAEEAFTIYDHVKVWVFKKNPDYSSAKVASILGAVDLSHVVHLTPRAAGTYKSLMLTAAQVAVQQAGGTWSKLFDWNAIQNKYPGVGVVIWYLVILALGLFTYPIVRAALPGLADHGYPLSRVVGLLLWAWMSWIAGSVGLTYSRLVIGAALGLIMLLGAWFAWRQRAGLRSEWKERWKYFLLVEGLFLVFFLLDLGIRLGNSDLWHPYKGGERPMDFSYFNAILKSTAFPPYDPWYAGGYINYYYFGYVIVGTPVKLLGIVPSIAYNFILPTLFACLAVSAFSIGWNLLDGGRTTKDGDSSPVVRRLSFVGGISASAALVLLGNLGTVRMFYQGFQRMAAPGGVIDKANIFQHIIWAVKGFALAVGGASLPYIHGDFYWYPSRVLPDASGSPITEFPLFTFLYSDLHAHMIAFMLTVLVIAWALSVLLAKAKWTSRLDAAVSLFLGGLTIGAIKPTNTWDFYTYLILALVVLVYAVIRYADVSRFPAVLSNFPDWFKRLLLAGGAAAILTGLSLLLYQPFSHWFGQAYNSVEAWKGGRSNISSYLTHWGVFLFFIVSWMIWETRNWMAETPVSSLRKLRPFAEIIFAIIGLIVLFLIGQQAWVMSSSQNVPWKGITILWVALPIAVWAAVLILRPGMPDAKRLVLFMVGTAFLLTMVVELVVIRGDVGRMNTVFKFYLQAWIMLGLSAAAALGWLLPEIRKWLPGWRNTWEVVSVLLVTSAAMFILIGGMDKIRDRWWPAAPHTLDSMAYMQYADYADFGVTMKLDEDFRAIRWMQENVQGSPVIVEANCPEYRWCSRFTIYTGLPGVVGWNWHQRQQRALMSDQVWNRVNEINAFYGTTDPAAAKAFLQKYNVRYIVVGQMERAEYVPGAPNGPIPAGSPDGLLKFEEYNGTLWKEVYRDGQTVIYEVPVGGEVLP